MEWGGHRQVVKVESIREMQVWAMAVDSTVVGCSITSIISFFTNRTICMVPQAVVGVTVEEELAPVGLELKRDW